MGCDICTQESVQASSGAVKYLILLDTQRGLKTCSEFEIIVKIWNIFTDSKQTI